MDDALTLNRQQRRTALAMALLGGVAPVLLATLADAGAGGPVFLVGAVVGGTAPILANLLTGAWRALGTTLRFLSIPALTMMQAGTGGIASPHTILLVMAMVYLAVRCTSRQLLAGLGLTVACCYVPMLVIGAPLYPLDVLRATEVSLVLVSVALSFGYVSREAYVLTRKLNRQASCDPMTQLLNRRGWDEGVTHARARARRLDQDVVLVLLDLDCLKHTNDTLGHARGDHLILDTGLRLRAVFSQPGAVLARLGGDEFAVLLSDVSPDDVRSCLASMRERAAHEGDFSAGIAVVGAQEHLDAVMRRADVALYAAKTRGRGRDELAASAPPARPSGQPA